MNLKKYYDVELNVVKRLCKGDLAIWVIILLLCVPSLLVVYSSIGTLAYSKYGGNTFYFLFKQGGFLLLGLIVVWLVHKVNRKWYRAIGGMLMFISLPLLALTLIFGVNLNEASRWLEIPGLGISFQTSDLAKIGLIMHVSRVVSKNQDNIKDFKKGFMPAIIPVVLICGLILPANFSTAAILGLTCFILMYVGRVSIKHLLAVAGVGALLVGLFIFVSLQFDIKGRSQTWVNRVTVFVGEGDSDSNFQSDQSKIAIASGGIIGKGVGKSTQRVILPHPYSDFIFAIIVEEFGLLGGVFVLMLYLVLLNRVAQLVRKERRTYHALLAFGLVLVIVIQAFVNMAVAVGLFPVTGQPLPIISMGGTSLFFTCAALGIVLGISREQTEGEKTEGGQTDEEKTVESNS